MIHTVQTVQAEPKTDEVVGDLPMSLILALILPAGAICNPRVSNGITPFGKTSFAKHRSQNTV